jgi:hypothetical protein
MTERAKVLREVADKARNVGPLDFFRWLHVEAEGEPNLTQAQIARAEFRKMLDDPDMELAYRSNVAMLLSDRYGMTDHETSNRAAKEILALICRDDYLDVLKEHDLRKEPPCASTLDDAAAGGPGHTIE